MNAIITSIAMALGLARPSEPIVTEINKHIPQEERAPRIPRTFSFSMDRTIIPGVSRVPVEGTREDAQDDEE